MSAVWLETAFAAGTCIGVLIGWLSARIVTEAQDTRVLLTVAQRLEELAQ